MKTKEETIKVMKSIFKENKDINLSLGEEASACWRGKPSDKQWKDIGRISALSWIFGIKTEDIK